MWFESFTAAIFHSSGCWFEASTEMLLDRVRDTPLQLSPDVRLLLALQIPRGTKDVPH